MNSLILIGIIISVVASGSMTKAADIPVVKYIAGMAGTTALVIIAGLLFKLWLGLRGMKVELSRLTLLYRRLGRIYQLLVVAVYAAQIYLLHWPALVSWFAPATARSVLLAEVLVVMPFLILVYLSWLTFFSADRSFRRITARPTLTLSQYLILLTRQNLFIMLGPLMVLLAIRDVSVWSLGAQESEAMIGGVIFVSLGLFVVFSGVWMKLCFAATPMPAGGLRSRLEALASRARLRVRDILHWPTYSTILNGCVVGPIGRFRYIMMTDALLETLPAQEIEAVFAHEIGHIKHRHMLLYIVFIAGGLALTTPVDQLVWHLTRDETWTQVAATAEVLLFWVFGFGYLSRRCELQADIYAAQAIPCILGCRRSHTEILSTRATDRQQWDDALCPHKTAVFAEALEHIGRLNGSSLRARSWRHFSIARRTKFLMEVGENPDLGRRFERRLKFTKIAVALLSAAAVAYLVLASYLEMK